MHIAALRTNCSLCNDVRVRTARCCTVLQTVVVQVQYCTIQHCAALCCTVQYQRNNSNKNNSAAHGAVLYHLLNSDVHYITVLHTAVLCNSAVPRVQYCNINTLRHCTALYSRSITQRALNDCSVCSTCSTALHCTALCNTILRNTALCCAAPPCTQRSENTAQYSTVTWFL